MPLGYIYATLAYVTWGCYPLYWRQLVNVSPWQITAHRILWAFVFLLLYLVVTKQWSTTRAISRRDVMFSTASGLLVSAHWLVWLWTVNGQDIVEASLGSFLTSFVTMLLGVVFLHERLRRCEWIAVLLAFIGVVTVSIANREVPSTAFALAITFGLYGFVKKQTPLEAVHSTALEFGIMSISSLIYLIVVEAHGTPQGGSFGRGNLLTSLLLVGGGVVTAVPYVWFAAAAQRLPLTVLGLFACIVPTGNLVIGVAVYDEPFSAMKLVGFVCVWVGLAIFSVAKLSQTNRDDKMAILTPPQTIGAGVPILQEASPAELVLQGNADLVDRIAY
ncbi:hypothetical protein AeRB84_004668 [Aphanomyces euteiches]|nr:hypothetical protein AeRB84_004668 [Aphanomyces euteiches]